MTEDITKTGPVGLEGLKGINIEAPKQESAALNYLREAARMAERRQVNRLQNIDLPQAETPIGLMLANSDYGDSKYDKHAQTFGQFENLQDVRAAHQGALTKIGAGIAKSVITATTTFLDGVVGTVTGIANVVGDAITGNIHSAGDVVNSFVDNPFSNLMQSITSEAEQWLPNYYSKYEESLPWYQRLGTANFWADGIIKNVGFTVGAAGSAIVTGGAASKVLVKKGLRDAFKGVVKNSTGKELKTGADIYKAYKTGDAVMDGIKLSEDLGKAAKALKNAELKVKWTGSMLSAAGEGRIESIHTMNEWEEEMLTNLDAEHKEFAQKYEDRMFEEHPEWFAIDANGNRVIVSREGVQAYNAGMREELQRYEEAKVAIAEKKKSIGNSIFGLNLLILGGSNFWQFGRAITGGYTAGRNFKNLVKGNIKDGFTANKSLVRNKRLRALSSPLMEVQEEMSQAGVSEGSKLWGSSSINNDFGSFYRAKIDPDAEAETQDYFNSILQGFGRSYGDIDRWEEGFAALFTSILGIPKIKTKVNENGKKSKRLSLFNGELYDSWKDANIIKKESSEIADALNKRVQSEDFINYYQGMIRHNKYQDIKDTSVDEGNAFEFKNAEHSQMVSDAILFDKAGRLDDLYDHIYYLSNITEEDAKTIRELTVNKNTGKSIYDNKTDSQVVGTVKKNAQQMKETVDKYVEVSNNLKTLYGDKIDANVLEELTWGFTQVDNWENRLKQLYGEVREVIGDKAQILKDRYGIEINTNLNNFEDFSNQFMQEDRNLVDEINEIINNKNLTVDEQAAKIEETIAAKKQEQRDLNLNLGRKILQLRRDFKKSRERLEQHREKALATIYKATEEGKRLRDLRGKELEDYNAYAKQAKAMLTGSLKALHQTKNSLKTKAQKADYAAREKEIKDALQALNEGRLDIFNSFSSILDNVDNTLAEAEKVFNSDTVFDKRFKRGYDPKSKPVAIGSESAEGTQMVSEAEAEERSRVGEKNYNIFFELLDLKKALSDKKGEIISGIDVANISNKLIDMIKILAVRENFLDTYQTLSDNPELFQEGAREKLMKQLEKYTERKVEEEAEVVGKATSLAELREALDNIEDKSSIPLILDKLKNSDNEKLKETIKTYEELKDMESLIFGDSNNPGIIKTAIQNSPEDAAIYEEAGNRIEDVINVASSEKEAREFIDKIIEDSENDKKTNPLVTAAMAKVMERYNELLASKRSNKKDKKSSKKVKDKDKKSSDSKEKKRSAFSKLSEDLDDVIFDDEEDEGEEGEGTNNKGKDKNKKGNKKNNKKEREEEEEEDDDTLDDEDDITFDDEDDSDDSDNDLVEDDDTDSQDDSEIIDKLKEMSSKELEDVINGTSEILNGLDSNAKNAIISMANIIKKQKKAPAVHNGSRGSNSEENLAPDNSTSPGLRSWNKTKYEIAPLKDRKRRKAVKYSSPVTDKLEELGAFDFVDSGKLGILFSKNPNITIHYITAPSVKGIENIVLLAIEVTGDVKKLVSKEEKNNFITCNDGKQYQVVGSLGYNRDKVSSENYRDIVAELTAERLAGIKGKGSTDYIVSKKYTNKISHIYSGRMVKSTEDMDVETRSLKDILGDALPDLGIYYNDLDFRTPTIDNEEVVPINSNNMNPRQGSVWLMTREADGRYYAKAVQIRRFSKEEYDINNHKNTPLMKELRRVIRRIADPKLSDYERAIEKLVLGTILYMPGKTQLSFQDDVIYLRDADGKVVAQDIGKGKNIDEKVEEALAQLQELNLRFQVDTDKIDDNKYLEDLLDSDIITTDLAMIHNVNASFDMPLLDPNTGEALTNVNVENTKGHTGKRGIQSSLQSTTVIFGKNRYSLFEDGTVKFNDEEVTDQDTIDEVIFKNKVNNEKSVQPINGNSSLYITNYSSGEEFGLLDGKIVKGEKLKELKKKAAKEAKKEAQKNSRKNLEDESFDEDDEEFFKDSKEVDLAEILDPENTEESVDDEDDIDDESDDDDDTFFAGSKSVKLDELLDEAEEKDEDENEDDSSDDENEDDDEDSPRNNRTGAGLGETFVPGSNSTGTFDKLMIENKDLLKEAGFIPFKLKKAAEEKGIDLTTITTKEQLEGLITQIKCGKKK